MSLKCKYIVQWILNEPGPTGPNRVDLIIIFKPDRNDYGLNQDRTEIYHKNMESDRNIFHEFLYNKTGPCRALVSGKNCLLITTFHRTGRNGYGGPTLIRPYYT
jgi:hypothetical protein